MSQDSYKVSELNHFIRDVLKSGFSQPVWVCGEIQGYDRSKDKKHVFFELCEKNPSTHEIIARVGLVIFANARPAIEAVLRKSENAFTLKDDIEVRFLCQVDFYPGHGQVRLIVESIDPVYTLGKIAQDRQRLIAVLKDKGVLEKNKGHELADLPMCIGLITSYDSAAYHDFISELRRSAFSFRVFVVNTLMQGRNAEASVVRALLHLRQVEGLDVVVITRGGGSIAELSCFDSEKIALTIAASPWPVLSGIGHEINMTVTDLAAHTFAKTPTAIAQFLTARLKDFEDRLQEKQVVLGRVAQQTILRHRRHLKDNAVILQTGTLAVVKGHQQQLAVAIEAFTRAPASLVKKAQKKLADSKIYLKKTIYLRLQNSRSKIEQYRKLADLADPQNTLKRGFSITRTDKGVVLRSVKQAKAAQNITTQLADGSIASEVRK